MKKPQSLLYWQDWPEHLPLKLISIAEKVKKNPKRYAKAMQAQTLIMLFQKSSTRTRVSFEVGMTELGGHAIYLDWQSSNFHLSKISYEAAYLARNSTLIMARLKKHENLLELNDAATVPVINGCCNRYHPCQALTDMFTIYEDRGSLDGVKLTYIGVHNNVANSLQELAYIFNVKLTLVCPIGQEEVVDVKMKNKLLEKNLLIETLDVKEAVQQSDYVYTDTWIDLEFFGRQEYAKMQKERMEKNVTLPSQS